VLLSRELCRSARIARDARFDGRFFIAVKTTGIFCRPICPAPSPKEQNIEYFPSAAAAAEAGFRPCLRCRPECSPGTPAWFGSSATVSRALRQIGEGALDSEGVDELAERLGIGARHLRRLFVEHLGASPATVAQTQRLLSAKRLIDDTDLPLTAIAMAAGYGSIRRFNAAFLKAYGRSPRELRRAGMRPEPGGLYRFALRFRPPLDWLALLEFLGPRATPGVEVVRDGCYRRSIALDGQAGWLELRPGADHPCELSACIAFPDPARLLTIVRRARRMFDLDCDPGLIRSHLGADPALGPLIRARPGLRVPGAWDGFELGVRAILGQQVSVAGATTLAGRLVARFGSPLPTPAGSVTHTFPAPRELAEADLSSIGLPGKRAEAIRRFARAIDAGDLSFDGVADVDAFRRRLCEIPGVGEWTAQYVAMRALGEPDAFPASDLVLLRAAGAKTPKELEKRAEAWRPWRAYAALHLWQGVKDGRIGLLHVDGQSRRKAVAGGG
jgi:AraC family transcriptional regulator of adaptative response / DNA-3-methyladenine glycosylase II